MQSSQTVTGGYVAAGTGLRNRGYGTITISGIPAGASVKAAYLVWDILDNSQESSLANGVFNGAAIQGTFIGSGGSPCWPPSNNFAYFADVTSLVTGNGAYSLTGFASGATDASDPWNAGSPPPEAEGASLVVIYSKTGGQSETVQLYTGVQETGGTGPLSATLSGFNVGSTAGAQSTFIVADGQGAGSDAAFNGNDLNHNFLGADPIAPPPLSFGNLWDTHTVDVSSYLTAGDTQASATVDGTGDCLVWVGQVLAVPTGSSVGAPQNVQVTPSNGTAYVTWQPPATGANLVTGYEVTATPVYNDRLPAPNAGTVQVPVNSATTLSTVISGLVEDCHERYTISVSAVSGSTAGPAATSDSFRPSGIVTSNPAPPYVVILIDGINESQPGFTMNPYKPTLDGVPSYCPESWNSSAGKEAEADFAGTPNGPWSFFHKWNFGEVDLSGNPTSNNPDGSTPNTESMPRALPNNSQGIPVGTDTHSFMLDAIAAQGAVILPFSYKGFGFSPSFNSQPAFTFYKYAQCQAIPGCGPTIQQDASLLNSEVNTAAALWPFSKIVVMGHSQGGLIAFEWWLCSQTRGNECKSTHTQLPPNFLLGMSLDSPINGACGGLSFFCVGPPSYPPYGDRDHRDRDHTYLSLDASVNGLIDPFRFIGTFGDSPIGGYQSGSQTLEHQLLFDYQSHPETSVESLCSNSLDESGCPAPEPPDHISDCPVANDPDNDGDDNVNEGDSSVSVPFDDGPPLMASWETAHYVEKYCPGNVAYFNASVGLSY
jgi:hypothetical protein